MISFLPTEEQAIVRHMLEAFARDELRPIAREIDREGALDAAALKALAATGMVAAALELDVDLRQAFTSSAIAFEALAQADAASAVALAASLGYARAVIGQGTAEQRAELRSRWSDGGFRGAAILAQEPGFGFDVTAPRTRAEASGREIIVCGTKSFVPRARACGDFLVVVQAGHGLDAVLVPADTPGVSVLASPGTLGLRGLAFSEIRFDAVRLPGSAWLGGAGGADVQALLDSARVATAAILTGIAAAVLEHLVPYLKQRVVHGSALAQKQSVAFRLADMSVEIPSMRWMVWRAAAALDRGRPATREARLAQVHCAEQALWITDEGIQLMGGHGYLRDNPVERWYRDARTLASLEGVVGL